MSKSYEYLKKWREKNKDQVYAWQSGYNKKYREACLIFYGGNPPKCACCAETTIQFLAVDHINNDGAEHRKREKIAGGTSMYLWLIRKEFPKGFQILCHNCNQAKSFYGNCPHIKD